MKKCILFLFSIQILLGCKQKHESETLFRLLPEDRHGIDFQNTISESDSMNILTLEYIYNGAGVAVGDFNNDGLSDIFLTGNMVANKMFLNKGNLKFEDISATAGIGAADKWRSGVALADVNSDGLLDIYVCATIKKDTALRANMLFIHQGLDKNGRPSFRDEAQAYGVAYTGYSSNAAFLDYDNDGDLDLYILTNTIQKGVPTSYRPKINDGSTLNSDRLFRNNGNGSFTDVSGTAGIVHEGYGLGLAIADINQDGWQDVYVSNDYITNDLLYINNKDGTFTNAIDSWIKHQSQFSMGNDIADVNNDGLPDIITLDMLPEGNLRRKTVISGTNYTSYINNKQYGYAHQYIRNMLQLNNGNGTFSEIGQLAGLHQTEWSWSPLFADFDNDGFRDVVITNGFPRDITDKDFGNFRSGPGGNIASIEYLLDSIPVVKVSNYIFKNNGDLTFKDVTKEWGMSHPAFSNGASFADFDNDGDLDYIVNNINDGVLFYENTLYSAKDASRDSSRHFLRVKLKGPAGNTSALGAKVSLSYDQGKLLYHDHSIYRGYISSVEDVIHFGLGQASTVDSLAVKWPDGKITLLNNVNSNQVLVLDHHDAKDSGSWPARKKTQPLVKDVTAHARVNFVHQEDDKIDFNAQRTLPHKFSQAGPGIAVADVNGDGLDDFYIGGSAGRSGNLFLQGRDGTFTTTELKKSEMSAGEDAGALFFDADNDGDPDLYVVSGSFEYAKDAPQQQDRLYVNMGKGKFVLDPGALPSTLASGSCARAADIDQDGDLDLFVAGRVVPWQYPLPAESYILINEKGKFQDQTDSWSPDIRLGGMITDALWTDYNNDGKTDLITTGEFMPITVYKNEGAKLKKVLDSGLEKFSGWWNSITGCDFDRDGDIDYVAGNLGVNNYYKASDTAPLRVYAKDIDGNNSIDAILSCYLLSEDGKMKEYPVNFWDELNSQSPKFRKKFNYYKKFGTATIDKLLSPEERKDALVLEANFTSSAYIENLGKDKFTVKALPVEAQVAPINGIVATDIDQDGNTDLLTIGNDYGNEVFTGRYDAYTGLVLLGDGKGNFNPSPSATSGFAVDGDAKALVKLSGPKGSEIFVASQNRDSIRLFSSVNKMKGYIFIPQAFDVSADVLFADGRKERMEFYYGAGYLSQSGRAVRLPDSATEITVYDAKGSSRKVSTSAQ